MASDRYQERTYCPRALSTVISEPAGRPIKPMTPRSSSTLVVFSLYTAL